jgi:ATP-dependent Zn protease
MEEGKAPKKPLIYYYIIAIMIILLLNSVVLPTFLKQQVTQVDYSAFLAQIKNNKVTQVEMQRAVTVALTVETVEPTPATTVLEITLTKAILVVMTAMFPVRITATSKHFQREIMT